VVLFNRHKTWRPKTIRVTWAQLGYTSSGVKAMVRDLYAGRDLGVFEGEFEAEVESYDALAIKITPLGQVRMAVVVFYFKMCNRLEEHAPKGVDAHLEALPLRGGKAVLNGPPWLAGMDLSPMLAVLGDPSQSCWGRHTFVFYGTLVRYLLTTCRCNALGNECAC
jgi:hypothetical protein